MHVEKFTENSLKFWENVLNPYYEQTKHILLKIYQNNVKFFIF